MDNSAKTAVTTSREDWLETVRSQIASLRFGVGQIDVHDAAVVPIKSTLKVWLDKQSTVNTQPPAENLEA